jgi:myo-inositol-hexaphosphate 3-phosphohydrolase
MLRVHFIRMVAVLLSASGLAAQTSNVITVKPRIITSPVITDADDAAIWMHPTDPAKSLVIGTDKGSHQSGGLYTWNLDGTQKQRITMNRPNNIDVRYGFMLGNKVIDLAAVTLRDQQQVRIFAIDSDTQTLIDVTTLDSDNLLNKMFKSPYGLTMYKRPSDGLMFIIVSSRHDEYKDKLRQIRLEDDGAGHVKGVFVRDFGNFRNIVEGMAVDDELGYLYASEERVGIHKYYASALLGNEKLTFFGMEDSLSSGNNEGMAMYKCANGTGYILVSHPETHSIKVYRREGEIGAPHQHLLLTRIQDDSLRSGDGLEVSSRVFAANFPHGLLVWHNQPARNFRLYGWEDVAKKILTVCPESDGTNAVRSGSGGRLDNDGFVILQQNSPNPFSLREALNGANTEIRFTLKKMAPVQLTIYNLLGEEVRQLLNTSLAPGAHHLRWDARDEKGVPVSAGIYFYQLRADKFTATRRMVVAR